jgi:hypothetical protein
MQDINGGLGQNGGPRATIDSGHKIRKCLLEKAEVLEVPQMKKIVRKITEMTTTQKLCSGLRCHGIA